MPRPAWLIRSTRTRTASVCSIAVQADGKILAGGDFTTLAPNGGAAVTRNHIARLETDGRLDQTLNLSIVGNFVIATAVQPDGKILIGGIFTSVLGVTRNNIARLNTDGTLDTAFNPNANGSCLFNRGAGGRQDFGGRRFHDSIGGQTRNRIARLDATTGLADSFNPNANGDVYVNRGAGGRQDFGGRHFTQHRRTDAQPHRPARSPRPAWLIRSTRTRTVMSYSIAVQADGKILAGGDFFSQHRRTDAQPHRPARCHDRPG